jgi:phosphoglucosamine mutase
MAAHNNCIGGEQSGHIIFSQYASTGDGILTSLKMMEVMLAKKTTLSKLAEPVKMLPQVTKNIRVSDKRAVREDADVAKSVSLVKEKLGKSGRILLRESGTEPVIRIMIESESEALCDELCTKIAEAVKAGGHCSE